jgi:hypothetical protein
MIRPAINAPQATALPILEDHSREITASDAQLDRVSAEHRSEPAAINRSRWMGLLKKDLSQRSPERLLRLETKGIKHERRINYLVADAPSERYPNAKRIDPTTHLIHQAYPWVVELYE